MKHCAINIPEHPPNPQKATYLSSGLYVGHSNLICLDIFGFVDIVIKIMNCLNIYLETKVLIMQYRLTLFTLFCVLWYNILQ